MTSPLPRYGFRIQELCWSRFPALVVLPCLAWAGCALLEPPERPRSQRRVALEQRNVLDPEPSEADLPERAELQEEALPGDRATQTVEVPAEQAPAEVSVESRTGSLPAMSGATRGGDMESVLGMIGPTTPPHVSAALRLVEEGRSWLQRGQTERALESFERAVAVDPASVPGYYFLGYGHFVAHRYDQAEGFVGRGIGLAAPAGAVWQARLYALQGDILAAVGRYPQARDSYQQAVHADPANVAAQVGLSRLSNN
jgi:tetratricopeptide (TPR) repeat protein